MAEQAECLLLVENGHCGEGLLMVITGVDDPSRP